MKSATLVRIRAFTLVEVLTAVVIVGLLAMMLTANSSRQRSATEVAVMKMRAGTLNQAQASYIEEVGGAVTALANWTAQPNDEARYQLIRHNLQFPPATLSSFVINGFSITFASDPRFAVVLQQGSTVIPY